MYGIRNLTTWNPWGPLERLHAEFERNGRSLANVVAHPSIDVWSDGDDLRLRALVPGVAPEQLEIEIEGDQLTLRGRTANGGEQPNERWLRRERAAGAFTRTLQLPFAIDADGVQARLANGVLEMTLPRSAAAKPRRIQVRNS